MPASPPRRDRAPLFFGWRMVMVAFFVDFVAVGFFFYSYGVFFKAIASEFGDSRLGVSIGITVTQVVGAALAPLVGRALDRYPLRNVIGVGAAAMGTGFLLLGWVQNALQFYLVLGLFVGFGAASMGQLATAKLVANWFVRRRGTALGIAATGISVSGVIMPAISAAVIGLAGWREAFMIYGAFTLIVVLPLVLRFVVSRPEDIGLLPDGAAPLANAPAAALPPPPKSFLRNSNFWALAAIMGLLFCLQSATLIHMVPRLTDGGYSLVAASGIASVTAALGIAGKLVYGSLADRWDLRYAFWMAVAFQVAGQLFMLGDDGYYGFMIGAALFGFGMGGVVPMQGAMVGQVFGREAFGRVLGAMRPPMAVLQLLGVPFAGWVYDTSGTYTPAFITFLGVYALAALAVFALRTTKQPT